MTGADLLLHPLRLRILRAFLGDRALTTATLQEELPDIPPASLYRHVARLVEGGVLEVVGERPVRGAVERTYRLRIEAATLGQDEVAKMTRDEHRQAFVTFMAGLLGDFERYLAREHIDPVQDKIGYALAGVWVTDEEYADLVADLDAAIEARLALGPGDGRRRRIVGSIRLPADES